MIRKFKAIVIKKNRRPAKLKRPDGMVTENKFGYVATLRVGKTGNIKF